MQFEQKNHPEIIPHNGDFNIPAVLISQLIGLSIGIEDDKNGLGDENRQKLWA